MDLSFDTQSLVESVVAVLYMITIFGYLCSCTKSRDYLLHIALRACGNERFHLIDIIEGLLGHIAGSATASSLFYILVTKSNS